jgi:predicted dehydrogenase
MAYSAAIIGTGADPDDRDQTGYAMAYRHAPGYERLDDVELVACADIVRENALAFADTFDIPEGRVYEDYATMLTEVDIDIVSVCTPPSTHADIVVGCAESGAVDAIHCEKPMATTWGDCNRMVEACDREGVQLTIDHQRRFGGPFREAKRLLDEGTIGTLDRLECGELNLFDAGVHQFDLCRHMVDGGAAEWVLASIDYREENRWFGTHNETQAVANWRYDNGVTGLALMGEAAGLGADMVGCYLRLVGEEGAIEIGVPDGPSLRYRVDGQGWTTVDTGDTINGPDESLARAGVRKLFESIPLLDGDRFRPPTFYERAIAEAVAALDEGRQPAIAGELSLRATELAFASYESVRQRGRVDLPLDIEDHPLEAMVEDGVFQVEPDGERSAPTPES